MGGGEGGTYFLSLSHLDSEKIINRFDPDKNRKHHDPHQDSHLSTVSKVKECILQSRSRARWPQAAGLKPQEPWSEPSPGHPCPVPRGCDTDQGQVPPGW